MIYLPVGKDTRKILISKICPSCYRRADVLLEGEDKVNGYKLWLNGELIQRALPMLSPDERETLMTGYHSECWDREFGDL